MFKVVDIAADNGAFRASVAARVAMNALPLPLLPTLPLIGAGARCGRGIKDDTE
jgi:hypothetical protein